jgi:hypothetical protein
MLQVVLKSDNKSAREMTTINLKEEGNRVLAMLGVSNTPAGNGKLGYQTLQFNCHRNN